MNEVLQWIKKFYLFVHAYSSTRLRRETTRGGSLLLSSFIKKPSTLGEGGNPSEPKVSDAVDG